MKRILCVRADTQAELSEYHFQVSVKGMDLPAEHAEVLTKVLTSFAQRHDMSSSVLIGWNTLYCCVYSCTWRTWMRSRKACAATRALTSRATSAWTGVSIWRYRAFQTTLSLMQ